MRIAAVGLQGGHEQRVAALLHRDEHAGGEIIEIVQDRGVDKARLLSAPEPQQIAALVPRAGNLPGRKRVLLCNVRDGDGIARGADALARGEAQVHIVRLAHSKRLAVFFRALHRDIGPLQAIRKAVVGDQGLAIVQRVAQEGERAIGREIGIAAGVGARPLARGRVEVLRHGFPGHIQHIAAHAVDILVVNLRVDAAQVHNRLHRVCGAIVFGERAVLHGVFPGLGKAADAVVQHFLPAEQLAAAQRDIAAHDGNVGVTRMHVPPEDGQAGAAQRLAQFHQHLRAEALRVEQKRLQNFLAAKIRPVPIRGRHLF